MERDSKQTRLATYLNAIKVGKLVNFTVLVNELTKKSVPDSIINACFAAELVKPQKYRVQILDKACFSDLCERFAGRSADSRVAAALNGDSHRTRVSGSYLLLRNKKHPQPVVVWFEGGKFVCPIPQSRTAILIENLENYIVFDQLSVFLNLCGVTVDITNVDVIYASGNQVTNKLHQPFLEEYEQLLCLFDIDLGALKMYQSLCQLLPEVDLIFVYPKDIVERLRASDRRMDASERADLLNYRDITPELDLLIQLMRDNGTKLEQETYLDFSE